MRSYTQQICLASSLVALNACGANSIDLDASQRANVPTDNGNDSLSFDNIVQEMVADDSNVYWDWWSGTASRTQGCAFENCSSTLTNYAEGQPVAVNQDDIFLSSYASVSGVTTVSRCPRAGCVGAPANIAQTGPSYPTFKFDQESIYWVSEFDVYRCPLTGCGDVPELVAARLDDDPGLQGINGYSTLMLAGSTVYWAVPTNDHGTDLYSAAKDGSRAATLEPHVESLGPDIVAFDDRFYWVDGSNRILSCPQLHCSEVVPTVLVATDSLKGSLSVDERGVYWLDRAKTQPIQQYGGVWFCPASGCMGDTSPTLLSSNDVSYFTLSQQYLYWYESRSETRGDVSWVVGGSIFRTPKPSL